MPDEELSEPDVERAKTLRKIEDELSRIEGELKRAFGDMHLLLRKHPGESDSGILDVHRKIGAARAATQEAGDRILMAFVRHSQ